MSAGTIRRRTPNIDDYAVLLRRHVWTLLLPVVLAPFAGLAISFFLSPKYTSRSLLQVEAQVVPTGYVKPIVNERVSDRMTVLQQRVLSHSRIVDLVSRLGLAAKGKNPEAVIEQIRSNVSVTPAFAGSAKGPANAKPPKGWTSDDVPGFFVSYTSDNPHSAQRVCEEVTSMLLDENLKRRQETARATTAFLGRQLEDAKHNLDELDSRLAKFEKAHLGRLPTDVESNLKILSALDSQLDSNTQALNHGQHDKDFADSLLAQQVEAWKASQISPTLPSLREQLITLKNHLITLQSRYTDDHPDVVKNKTDIAEVESELAVLADNANSNEPSVSDKARIEPEPILRLRQQVHQDEELIARATDEQRRLKELVDSYQSKLAVSPEVEEQYKQLTRDSETAHAIYDGLLTDKNKAEVQAELEQEQQGEQVRLLDAANLPDSPSFPVRWQFAAGGFAAGLALGVGLLILGELRDRSIHDEGDVFTVLGLPMLACVPLVPPQPDGALNWRDRIRLRFAH
jgi:uncharacterized protein involved in exopolysaccharide biosynthesis